LCNGLCNSRSDFTAAAGTEKEVTIAQKDLGHYAGQRARMGRVLPDKLNPTALKTVSKPQPNAPES
jgi:hypothetical protein